MHFYSELDEKQLLVLLRQGDKRSFGELYQRYSPRIYGNLKKLLKSDYLTEELLQDVFVKVWDKRQDLDPERSFRSYLFRIAENQVYDFFRKAARDKRLEAYLVNAASEFYSHVEESLYRKESAAMINKAIAQLPPKRRHIFTLCKLEGRSYEEVSLLLGVSTSTINDHVVKASRTVRDYLLLSKDMAVIVILAALFR